MHYIVTGAVVFMAALAVMADSIDKHVSGQWELGSIPPIWPIAFFPLAAFLIVKGVITMTDDSNE